MDTVGLRVPPLGKLETFPHLNSIMSQRLGASTRRVTAPNNIYRSLDVLNKHTSRLKIHFLLLNPTDLNHYRVTCIVLLSNIKF
jgi:hypothetical protein